MEDDVWDENRYKNWVRGAKGLEFLQEGLKDFVCDKAPVCRDQHLRNILAVPIGPLPQCNQCTSENLLPEHARSKKACDRSACIQQYARNCFGSKYIGRRKCPNGICSKLYDAIVLEHLHRDPLWKNTDPTTWCSDPKGWSFAKCFETIPGPGTSAQDTDASGLLSILINNLSMQNWLACPNMGSNNACPFYQARYIRNEILHKPKMELDDQTLNGYLDTFVMVLEDPKCLKIYSGSPDAIKKLTELKSKQIHISQKDEKRILKLRQEALSELDERKQEVLQEIEDRTSKGLTAVSEAKTEAVQKIKDEKGTGITEVEKAKTEAVQIIKDEKGTGITAVEKAKTEAVQIIKDEKGTGITAVEKAKTEAVQIIKDAEGTGLTAVEKVKTEAVQIIKDEEGTGLNAVEKAKTEAVQIIKDEKDTGLTAVEKAKTEAVQIIKDEKGTGLTAVEKAKTEAVQIIKDEKGTGLTAVEKAKTKAVQIIKDEKGTGLTAVEKAKTKAVQIIKDETGIGLATAVREISKVKRNTLSEISMAEKETVDIIYDRGHAILSELEVKKQQVLEVSTDGKKPSASLDPHSSKIISELQDDLISFYRRQHSKITLSPLVDEDTPLLKFYVMPDINSVEVKRARGGGNEERTPISSFRSVFYKTDKLCSEIYLTADAGLGKTALCKRLALAWCQAKKPLRNEKRYFSKEEIGVMNGFRFVFLLLLRDCAGQCDIDDMIMTQIVSQLGHRYDSEYLENIMCKEKCLVISDGLDEWTHPANSCKQVERNIPHRKARDCTTVLTTTRPWRLNASGLKPSDIDQRLEITGLNRQSAFMLKRSVISHLKGEKDEMMLQADVENFSRAVNEKQISDLEAIPLLLMYLLFLWYYGIELGQSQCDLYSKIIELLLSRTVQKHMDISSLADPSQGDIPQCFSTQTRCRQFYSLLTALGQLAFQTLFKETREENTLVFDSSVAEQYLNKDCLTFCLSTGIITQSKVQGNPMKQESKVSFAHKTVQEFFAALYMHSAPDHTSVAEIVASKCKCVKDILDMSKILKFIIGINVNVVFSISRELMKIINEDEITREYRSTLHVQYITTLDGSFSHPLLDFQDMCISCCKELPHENEVSLCLQDVYIDWRCQQEQYREHLKQLTTRNTQNIRSLYIDMFFMKDTPYNSVQKVVEYFAFNGLENIEKIKCQDGYNERAILPLLNRSVKCLSLSCDLGQRGSWSRLLHEKVASLQKLEAIDISVFDISHSELTLICDYISHTHCMRQIVLEGLRYTDHEWPSCTGAILDLSQHSQLSELTLCGITVRTVNVNMAALEKCWLQFLLNRDLVLRFLNCDPADSKLNTFYCYGLQSRAAIDPILDTLPGLHQVKRVELWAINLGDRELKLSPEMKNLKRVELGDVTMAASSLRGVVDCVDQLPQTVEVVIRGCTITPEREFVTVRDKIKTSPRFRVTVDSKDADGWITFKFATIKYGD